MTSETQDGHDRSIELTTELVSAYVLYNPVPSSQLPNLIKNVYAIFSNMMNADTADGSYRAQDKANLSQIRRSIMPDALISFIDGKPYKTLKRHLTSHGLDPSSYRERYGLPSDYPMVSPDYAERRSEIAKASGLGATASRGHRR